MHGPRNQAAEEAHQEISEEEIDADTSAAADPRWENGGKATGEEQAAKNREQDPPA